LAACPTLAPVSRARVLGLAVLLTIPFGVASSRAAAPPPIVFAANLAPAVTGEIYRLDPDGRREDLSKSPWQDTQPTVSTDGKRVAFLSNRSGHTAVYEVGINGGNLVRVAPTLGGGYPMNLAWQPHGSVLAAQSSGSAVPQGRVFLLRPHRKPLVVSRSFAFGTAAMFFAQQPWSPDGRVLLVWAGGAGMRAVSPAGRTLWKAYATQPITAWSARGLFAVPVNRGVAVYDEAGKRLFRFRLAGSHPTFTWSPNGGYLATYYSTASGNYQVDVRTAAGKFVLHKEHLPGYQLAWAGDSEVVIGLAGCPVSACGEPRGIDIRTGKESRAPPGWLDPLSPDRKLAIVRPTSGSGYALGTAPPGGGSESVYTEVGDCYGDGDRYPAASFLQFAGRTRSLVYQSWNYCDDPFSNLYSMASNGVDLQRLTNVEAEETQPATSPDGSEIAYVWASGVGMSCKGCSDGIRVANADGTALRTLTNPEDCTFDDSPSWSPDGKTILYAETGCDTPSELYTIPADGGAPHDLGIAGNDPAWGPSRIAYVLGDQSDGGLYTAKPDGSDPVKVDAKGRKPAWSADGRLAYVTGSAGTTVVVGSAHVTLPLASIGSLAWSPDGTQFVLVARKKSDPAYDVYTVNTDGTNLVRHTWNYGALGAGW
jgi:Tol biopolymer transport system component